MKNKNYVTSAEFAEKVGLTPQAVNKSAKLKDYRKKINGKSYIHIDAFALYGVPYAVAVPTRQRNTLGNFSETADVMEMLKKIYQEMLLLKEENQKLKNQIMLLPSGKKQTKRIRIVPVK